MKRHLLKYLISFRSPRERKTSEFSRFFRTASSREKKKVFLDIARKASEDQQKVLEKVR